MSTFANLLTVIQQLPVGTVVKITKQWCTSQGLIVNTQLVRSWGKIITNDPRQYGLDYYPIPNGQGIHRNKSSNNLAHYVKI